MNMRYIIVRFHPLDPLDATPEVLHVFNSQELARAKLTVEDDIAQERGLGERVALLETYEIE